MGMGLILSIPIKKEGSKPSFLLTKTLVFDIIIMIIPAARYFPSGRFCQKQTTEKLVKRGNFGAEPAQCLISFFRKRQGTAVLFFRGKENEKNCECKHNS
jgi:hypothetical protein